MTPDKIKRIRESLQMTQTEFAAKIGVELRAIQRWEADETLPSHRKPRGAALKILTDLERSCYESAKK